MFIVILLSMAGCMGGNKAAVSDVHDSNINQTLTDQSRKTVHVDAQTQLAYKIQNFPNQARDYLDEIRPTTSGFNPDKVVVMLEKVILRPDSVLENVASAKIQDGKTAPIAVALLNGNRGPGSTLENYSLNITVPGTQLTTGVGHLHNDRADRLHNGGGGDHHMHPADLQKDDPEPELVSFAINGAKAGVYPGVISIQSKDKEEITRRFKLILE